ncbi:MAG TPA: class I SAM-dependent methyltransferase [Phycisphaerales bacterium]|nr:class I SAM-dependent methyltransferase [Phycisphaerales bacterium]
MQTTGTVLDLYEACCQRPSVVAEALAALHGGTPTVLHEDFCGSAAVSRVWCEVPGRRAVATDLDGDVLAHAQSRARDLNVTFIRGSVLDEPPAQPNADIIFAGNFSVGEFEVREDLVQYLARCHRRLRDGGVFMCDLFGATPRPEGGSLRRMIPLPGGGTVEYTWEQRAWDPWSANVQCVIHFRVLERGEVTASYPEAFTYFWRVWGVAEFIDTLHDAGVWRCEVLDLVTRETPAPDARAVCVVARKR